MELFQKLGTLIEHRWRAENYSEPLFPDIAAEALAEADLPSKVDPWEIIRWVHSSITLPEQKDVPGRFGNPPITLFSGPRFYIDVYYWLDGTTSIHQHAFTGAFQVLLGSSIHSHYNFREDRILSEHFSVGEITLNSVDLLKVNDIKQIRPGRQYIHSLFHLDRPSATITIRTEHTPSSALQYDYRKPYFAVNPFFENVSMVKKRQTVGLLLGMKHKDADQMIKQLVASSDFHTAYMILLDSSYLRNNQMDALFGLSNGRERFEAMLESARSTHGDLVDQLVAVLAEQDRQASIIQLRGTITGEEHRFFLALLLNIPSRERILELIKQRFPEIDPVEKILDWVEEMGQTRVLGSKEPNALGIEGFDDTYVMVLESLLKGQDVNLEQFYSGKVNEEPTTAARTRIEPVISALKNSPLFSGILSTQAREGSSI